MLAEVGSKDADFIMAPYVWVEQIERDLQAGAWKVIAEARESGTAGHLPRRRGGADGPDRRDRARGRPRAADLRGAAARAAGVAAASTSARECNLGNIAPADVLSLETLRLGLRSDTVERFALGGED